LDKSYRAKGEIAATGPKGAILVELNGKQEAIPDAGTAASESDRAVIDHALGRLLQDLDYCIDRAHRGRWTGDDPRLERCVCPLVSKWHFAKVGASLRTDRPLVAGRFGFSFTVTPEGKVEKCLVWSGAAAPPEPVPAAATTTAAPGAASTPGTPAAGTTAETPASVTTTAKPGASPAPAAAPTGPGASGGPKKP
jgi:hypothetical protein